MKNLAKSLLFVLAFSLSYTGFGQMAKVIVFRDTPVDVVSNTITVSIDGMKKGELKRNDLISAYLAPGVHTIALDEGKETLDLNAENGGFYVIQYASLAGINPKLKLLTLEEAREESKFFRENYRGELDLSMR